MDRVAFVNKQLTKTSKMGNFPTQYYEAIIIWLVNSVLLYALLQSIFINLTICIDFYVKSFPKLPHKSLPIKQFLKLMVRYRN